MNKLVLFILLFAAACANHKADTLTLILSRDTVFYYTGTINSRDQVKYVTYKDIREVILSQKKSIGDSVLVVIKPAADASYKQTVDILDEMTINNIKRYAMVEMTSEEEKILGKNKFGPYPPETISVSTPTSVTATVRDISELTFYLGKDGQLSYSVNDEGEHKAVKIRPVTTANIVKAIDKVAQQQQKKASDLTVQIKGDNKARYEQFKTLMDALRQREMFNFKIVTEPDQNN